MKDFLTQIWQDYSQEIKEGFMFSLFVMFGVIVRVIKGIYSGTKLTFFWFMSEAVFGFFIAIIGYAIFDQFFHLKQFLIYAICAFMSSNSKIIQKKMEEVLVAIFDAAKLGAKELIDALVDKVKR
ncbi:hypothetical protein [Flavobacterium kingsejongi]|uniref:Holin n=1 Tax=Flavobacterium kingsejongi TaxID=1678728 RepID=A0A2S1LU83_9FLAO|nr:hypothetical protein [Flavobacterium kingsejongi]AWG25985.1 hypothetical protein FK004_12515 [Flavobacterium kingsejongi]AWG27196.1 hypothetical protein FK004_19225 [Flavobacterium kingsejongi]